MRLLIILILLATPLCAETYVRNIDGDRLTISAPVIVYGNRSTRFSAPYKRYPVKAKYRNLELHTQKLEYRRDRLGINIDGDFVATYNERLIFKGKHFEYDLVNDQYEADRLTVNYLILQFNAGKMSSTRKKVSLENINLGTQGLKAGVRVKKLDFYPGLKVVQNTYLYFDTLTFFWFPTLIADDRRNAYQIPAPVPQFKLTQIRGNEFLYHVPYLLNENAYGAVGYHFGARGNNGLHFNHMQRLSQTDFLSLDTTLWTSDNSQYQVAFRHDFLDPLVHNPKDNIFEKNDSELAYAKKYAPSIEIIRSINWEYNDLFINRFYEIILSHTQKFGTQSDLELRTAFGEFQEFRPTSNIQNARSTRHQTKVEYHYHEPKPWFFDQITYGLAGVELTNYYNQDGHWERLYSYIDTQKRILFWNNSGRLTHFYRDAGQSVFIFDQRYTLSTNYTNIAETEFFALKPIRLTLIYDINQKKLFNYIYAVGILWGSLNPVYEYDDLRRSSDIKLQLNL